MKKNKFNLLRGPSLRSSLKNSSVAIVGLGKSGISAATCLLKIGAEVFLSEAQPRNKVAASLAPRLRRLESEFGRHTKEILKRDLVVVSPGIDWDLPVLKEARKRKIPVWGELELGWRLGAFGKCAAITGTNGKTTAVSLLGDMGMRAKMKTLVAG